MLVTLAIHRPTWASIWILLGFFGLAALGFTIDGRLIEGGSVWSKPIKFAASFALHLVTLVVLAELIDPAARRRCTTTVLLWVASAAAVIEVAYVCIQALRGRASHFNFDTALESFLYFAVMGGAALVIIAATIGIGVQIARRPAAGIGAGLRYGAILGLVGGSIATLMTAGPMASGALTEHARWVGGSLSHADGLPVVGWSTTGGDLRVPHFFTTHIIQVVPFSGLIADRLWPERSLWIILAAFLAMLAATAATFAQALAGLPVVAV